MPLPSSWVLTACEPGGTDSDGATTSPWRAGVRALLTGALTSHFRPVSHPLGRERQSSVPCIELVRARSAVYRAQVGSARITLGRDTEPTLDVHCCLPSAASAGSEASDSERLLCHRFSERWPLRHGYAGLAADPEHDDSDAGRHSGNGSQMRFEH